MKDLHDLANCLHQMTNKILLLHSSVVESIVRDCIIIYIITSFLNPKKFHIQLPKHP